MTVPPAKTTAGELAAVAGHYEQRVVDPNPKPDHRCKGWRGGWDLEDVAQEGDRPHANGKARDRGENREPHRHNSPEREEQDHDRSEEPGDLGEVGGWLGDLLSKVAASRRVKPCLKERLIYAYDPLRPIDVQLRGAVLEVQRDVADGLVFV